MSRAVAVRLSVFGLLALVCGLVTVVIITLNTAPVDSGRRRVAEAFTVYATPLLLLAGVVGCLLHYRWADLAEAQMERARERLDWLERFTADELVDELGVTWRPGGYLEHVQGHLWRDTSGPYSWCHRPGCRLPVDAWDGRPCPDRPD